MDSYSTSITTTSSEGFPDIRNGLWGLLRYRGQQNVDF